MSLINNITNFINSAFNSSLGKVVGVAAFSLVVIVALRSIFRGNTNSSSLGLGQRKVNHQPTGNPSDPKPTENLPVNPPVTVRRPTPKVKVLHTFDEYQKNPDLMSELAEFHSEDSGIKNTGLTKLLASFAFGKLENYKNNKEVLDSFLKFLADRVGQDENAKNALTRPNNFGEQVTEKSGEIGKSQNNPLVLLVKMGNYEGIKNILIAYGVEDLLYVNSRGNSALHFAIMTGQIRSAIAIMERAEKLGVLHDLLTIKNNANYAADDILKFLRTACQEKKVGDRLVQHADNYLGIEEMNKALANQTAQTNARVFNNLTDSVEMGVRVFHSIEHMREDLWTLGQDPRPFIFQKTIESQMSLQDLYEKISSREGEEGSSKGGTSECKQ